MSDSQFVASAPAYEVFTERDVMMPLRDGVCVATDLYFPAQGARKLDGPWPAVMVRTPYDKTNHTAGCRFYAERGYVAVAQDVRGRYASAGEFYAFPNEGPDRYDAVEWVAAQPWCNGRGGAFGASD